MACNFNCLVTTEGHFKVTFTGSYVCCKNRGILEMVQDRDVVALKYWSLEV